MLAADYVGHVVGGWEYVWAAYVLTWAGLLFYGGSLWLQRRKDP
jgi:hypothetical protein